MLLITLLTSYKVLGLNKDCLKLNELVPRADIGDAFSNEDELVQGAFNDSRVANFTICIDDNQKLVGVQFNLYSEL